MPEKYLENIIKEVINSFFNISQDYVMNRILLDKEKGLKSYEIQKRRLNKGFLIEVECEREKTISRFISFLEENGPGISFETEESIELIKNILKKNNDETAKALLNQDFSNFQEGEDPQGLLPPVPLLKNSYRND